MLQEIMHCFIIVLFLISSVQISILTPTEHHLVIQLSVNCLTVSVQRMVRRYLESCVMWALKDPTAKMSLK